MDNNNEYFPSIKRSIEDFVQDEDGSITRSKLLMIGSMIVLLGAVFTITADAGHSSHRSHSSHSSHSSTSYHRSHVSHTSAQYHSNHSSHSSHTSNLHSNHTSGYSYDTSSTVSEAPHSSHSNAPHSSHSSHTSHSNTSAHSNSHYSQAGDYTGPKAPSASSIKGILTPQANSFVEDLPTISASIDVGSTPEVQSIYYVDNKTNDSDNKT